MRQEFPTAKGGAIGGRGFTFVAGRHGLIGPGAATEALACQCTLDNAS